MSKTVVSAPLCSPARYWVSRVTKELKEYGAPSLSVHVEQAETEFHITVGTTEAYADWAEKLLLTMGYGWVKLRDMKNLTWAQAYLSKRPADSGWYQPGCAKKPHGAFVSELQGGPPPS